MNIKTIIAIVVAVILMAGAGIWLASRSNNTSEQSSSATQATPDAKTESSMNEIIASGKAQECDMTYSGPNGSGNGKIYTDGNGRGRYTFSGTSEQGNTGEVNQILKDGKAYGWFQSSSQTIGFVFNTSANSSSRTTGGGPGPNDRFSMTCKSWNVNESTFELPAGVNFLDANALNPAS